ncbi:protein ELF4-LIKE 3-like [Gossypium australe]|uniref:Protein ELF4-LIKE 3-like n=1 Tax=Gossypium australe TaxID=47621 RepID=A0A5B6VGZ2_9ROSI|nr:protein ELF4-LIKE 3-like [Gossypium australe]
MEGETFSRLGNGSDQMDPKVVQTLQKGLVQVQTILDQNRLLINEINMNHESKVPPNLTRNVGLIRELNNNIKRVVDLYTDLSISFIKSSIDVSSNGDDDDDHGSSSCGGALKSNGKGCHKRNRVA